MASERQLTITQERQLWTTHMDALAPVHKLWLWDQHRRIVGRPRRHHAHSNLDHRDHVQLGYYIDHAHRVSAGHQLWKAYHPYNHFFHQ